MLQIGFFDQCSGFSAENVHCEWGDHGAPFSVPVRAADIAACVSDLLVTAVFALVIPSPAFFKIKTRHLV